MNMSRLERLSRAELGGVYDLHLRLRAQSGFTQFAGRSRHRLVAALVRQGHRDHAAGGCLRVIRRLGGILTWFTGEELGSVLTTFQRHTAFLDLPGHRPPHRQIIVRSYDLASWQGDLLLDSSCRPPRFARTASTHVDWNDHARDHARETHREEPGTLAFR